MNKIIKVFFVLLLFFGISLNVYADEEEIKNPYDAFSTHKPNFIKYRDIYLMYKDNYTHQTIFYSKNARHRFFNLYLVVDKENYVSMFADFHIAYVNATPTAGLLAQSVIFEHGDNLTLKPLLNTDYKAIGCSFFGCTQEELFKYQLSPEEIEKFYDIANATNSNYRVYGLTSYQEFKLRKSEKQAILDMLALYKDFTTKTGL